MVVKKYINIKEVVDLTGQSHEEIRSLAQNGVLPAHKARRGHWRLNVEDVEKYFGIQINKPEEEVEKTKPLEHAEPIATIRHPQETRLVINDKHYEEVIERICDARKSIKIMTANIKRFNLKPTDCQGKGYDNGTPFVKYLMTKAVQGVSVQVVCSMPSLNFSSEWREYYKQMGEPKLFEYKFCDRNHAKVVIIDDQLVYVGSANVTPAGIGQGIFTPGNFEAGIITENQDMIASANALFSMAWNPKCHINCHRKKKCQEKSKNFKL